MWPDVIEMRNFYATPLGQVARRMIRRRIRELWPDVAGRNMMGLGYSTPYLRYYREEAKRLVAVMPAEQGAFSWSHKAPNVVILAEETQLPLLDKSVDFALLVHALEFTSHPHEMIREVWRVLADGGRLMLIVPNRSGFWGRTEKTPFGQGHTYRLSQLIQFLKENTFTPQQVEHALYVLPSYSRILLSTTSPWEKIGHKWFRTLSGVLILEVSKEIYSGNLAEEMAWKDKLKIAKKLILPLKS